MHYHIFWGLRTAPEPFILNFSDKDEAIDKFIELIRSIEGYSDQDEIPAWREGEYDENTYIVQFRSENYKYMIVYCNNQCETKSTPYPMNIN